jgi:hypothetical protein
MDHSTGIGFHASVMSLLDELKGLIAMESYSKVQ